MIGFNNSRPELIKVCILHLHRYMAQLHFMNNPKPEACFHGITLHCRRLYKDIGLEGGRLVLGPGSGPNKPHEYGHAT